MNYIPHLAYDSVVFGFSGQQLKILVMEYHNTGLFALPGGFVKFDEDLDNAVRRGLQERTGIQDIFLEQFHTFGSLNRFQPEVMRTILQANDQDTMDNQWLLDRFVSVGYYALINYENVTPKPDSLSDSCRWYPIDQLPKLIQDHSAIVDKAIHMLRKNIDRKLVGVNLLPEKFTMKELQDVYEGIMGESIRRTSFQRDMLATGMLIRHEKRFSGKAHKAPFLYSFVLNDQ
ncbi:MAG: NUDIX domain-containing protein [Chryseolinea sp.]